MRDGGGTGGQGGDPLSGGLGHRAALGFPSCPHPPQCPQPRSLSLRTTLGVPVIVPTHNAPETPSPPPATTLSLVAPASRWWPPPSPVPCHHPPTQCPPPSICLNWYHHRESREAAACSALQRGTQGTVCAGWEGFISALYDVRPVQVGNAINSQSIMTLQ